MNDRGTPNAPSAKTVQALAAFTSLMLVLGCATTPTAEKITAKELVDEEAAACILRAAEKGYDREQTEKLIDSCIQRPLGIALERRACNGGEMNACLNLGSILRDRGDEAEASKWYRRAAEHGNAEAQNALGVLYLQGRGVPEEFSEALTWISKAAEQGHGGAQRNLAMLLRRAAENGDSEEVRDVLESGVDVNEKNDNGFTPLMFAAMAGHAEVVDTLIKAGADVNAEANGRVTALMSAVVGGEIEVVKALLGAGADVNVVSAFGETALAIAVSKGNGADVVEILIDAGADVSLRKEQP